MDNTKLQNTNWPRAKLGQFFQIKHGYAFKGEFFTDSGQYILLTPGNFKAEGGIILKGEKEKYYEGDFPQEFLLKKGDLLVVMTDLTQNAPILGSPAFIKEDHKFLHNQRLGKIVDLKESKLDPLFLFYLFNFNRVRSQIKASATGATVKHTAPDRIYAVEVALPPLPIQRKIADILSAYDDLIENNTRRIAILEETAQMLYQEWFVKFRFPGHEQAKMVESELGMIPAGWKVVRFFDIAEVMSGGTPKTTEPTYWNGNIPFYTPKDAPNSFFVTTTEKSITDAGLKSCNSRLYPQNTVFITARGTVGRVALNAVDMAMNQSCYALQGRDEISQFFTFLHIKNCIRHLRQTANGAVFEAIIVDTFKWLQVVKPPIALVDAFIVKVTPIFDQILNLTRRNANLRRTRDILLPKLIAGEIDVSSWVEGEVMEEAAEEMATSVARTTGVYGGSNRASNGRKVAEVGTVEPIKADELEWHSLWE